MQDVWNAVRIGADSYLQRQLRTILPQLDCLTIALFLSVYVVPPSHEAVEELERKTPIIVAIGRNSCIHYGCNFFVNCGSVGHADGDSGQRSFCIGCPPRT